MQTIVFGFSLLFTVLYLIPYINMSMEYLASGGKKDQSLGPMGVICLLLALFGWIWLYYLTHQSVSVVTAISPWVMPGLIEPRMSLTNPTHAIYNALNGSPVFIGTLDECNVEFNQQFNTKSAIPMIPDYYVDVYHKQHEMAEQ